MADVKQIVVKVIPSHIANEFVKKHHYSGKVVSNSQLHFGAFLDGNLHGVMSYGPSTDKSKLIGLVEGTKRNEFIELNRMAFDEHLPRNSESRCISISIRLIKKNAPHIKRIVSFADGCQCGDGTIYRASGFELSGIKENKSSSIIRLKNGEVIHSLAFRIKSGKYVNEMRRRGYTDRTKFLNEVYGGYEPLKGYMLRYIKLLKPDLKRNYEVIPFSMIDSYGAGMYKGERISREERHEKATDE